jgi:hypothetical protein
MIPLALQLVAAGSTVLAMWLMGNKDNRGPAVAIFSDACFIILNAWVGLWALVGFCALMALIHTRNLIKWRADA